MISLYIYLYSNFELVSNSDPNRSQLSYSYCIRVKNYVISTCDRVAK